MVIYEITPDADDAACETFKTLLYFFSPMVAAIEETEQEGIRLVLKVQHEGTLHRLRFAKWRLDKAGQFRRSDVIRYRKWNIEVKAK